MNTNDEVKTREKEYHDRVFKEGSDARDKALVYYSITSISNRYYLDYLETKIGKDKNLLEYGCGAGGDLNLYKSTSTNLYGIDISSEAIDLAKRKCEQLDISSNYTVSDAEETNFENDFFDAVVGSGIIHHLNIDKAMSELSRIIKKNGVCIFHEPMGHNPIINLYRYLTPNMRTPDEHPIIVNDFDIMHKYFKKVEVKYFYLISLISFLFRKTFFFNTLNNFLITVDNYIFKLCPWLGKHSWVSVIILSEPIK